MDEHGVRRAELIAALSLATDLGTGLTLEHGLRACLIAAGLAEQLGLGAGERADAYHAGLLVYVGCTGESHHVADLLGDEHAFGRAAGPHARDEPARMVRLILAAVGKGQPALRRAALMAAGLPQLKRRFEAGSAAHCDAARLLVGGLGLGDLEPVIAQVFERWDGKGYPGQAKGDGLAVAMRVAHVADDAAMFYQVGGADAVREALGARSGRAFDPDAVATCLAHLDELLAPLAAESVWDQVLAAEPGARPHLAGAELDQALETLAGFADLKSVWTVGHSAGVAGLAAGAAERCRLPAEDVARVRRAALVHDLGRVAVSILVWDKAGPLSADERERMRLHPYHTERVLRRSAFLGELGALASLHHERLDGSGYHRGSGAAELPPAARILAAADAYEAMTRPRPHRQAHPPERAAELLAQEARAGRLDTEAVRVVLAAAGQPAPRIERPAGLTEREVEVLLLLVQGKATKQVATALGISAKTADHHVEHIYEKLGVSTRAGAALFAMRHGLVAWGQLPIPRLPGPP